ncbi:MAG: hypothetical protein JSR61_20390 [Proteobacteria bacterium]|nr:hypothetical protein [Pseudomonadota bacterium]
MRIAALAVIALTAGLATPSFGEDSFLQISPPVQSGSSAYARAPEMSYDECFQLGWVRGVHVERGEWDAFYEQCKAGDVPFESGMAVDSVRLNRGQARPHS